jgi:hypothetical protein
MDMNIDVREQLRLQGEEQIHLFSELEEALVAVTDRRLIVREAERFALDLPIEDIRRIQFDVERGRTATFVVVPHSPSHQPQVLGIPHDQLEPVSRMVCIVGQRLGLLD